MLSGASRYPSGLNPALCPNYPHCDNVLLAAYVQSGARSDYNVGQYGSDNYQHHPSRVYNHKHQLPIQSPFTEPGYPAGLTSSNCPNYPYCSHQVPTEALRYTSHNKYPAGVTPHNCPNYPYCY